VKISQKVLPGLLFLLALYSPDSYQQISSY